MTARFSARAAWAPRLLALLALALALLSACALPKGKQELISGTIQARLIVDSTTGTTRITGVAARIACGDGTAHASASGAYHLSASVASSYPCTISAPGYGAVRVEVPGSSQANMVVNFAADWLGSCSITARPGGVTCPSLQPPSGTLSGTVVNPATDTVARGVNVTCWNTDPVLQAAGQAPPSAATQTDQVGHFSLVLTADRYACVANDDARLYAVVVAPARTTSANFEICDPNCPAFDYHNGQVMHSLTAYLIFWLPTGNTFEPGGSDKRYESLIAQYFNDVGGSSFYEILTQYWDHQGPVSDSVSLGGTYVDTTPYPHAGTQSDPLLDSDIQNEVSRAIATNKWPGGPNAMFFLFTGYDVQSCSHARGSSTCSFQAGSDSFCGYHSGFPDASGTRIYAYISDVAACAQLPTTGEYPSPNSDAVADAELSIVSHEQFEAVSDPLGDGWYDTMPQTGEMADKCENEYGNIRPDGSNVTLNHGHSYILQAEWSLADNGCVFSYTPRG